MEKTTPYEEEAVIHSGEEVLIFNKLINGNFRFPIKYTHGVIGNWIFRPSVSYPVVYSVEDEFNDIHFASHKPSEKLHLFFYTRSEYQQLLAERIKSNEEAMTQTGDVIELERLFDENLDLSYFLREFDEPDKEKVKEKEN